MKKILSLILIVSALACLAVPVSASGARVYYVSTAGNNNWNGSYEKPFRSLDKAISASAGFDGQTIIYMMGGEYSVSSATKITSRKNIRIESYMGESVTISSAKKIPYEAFEKVTDEAILSRVVEQSGRDNLMAAYLPDLGITSYGSLVKMGYTRSTSVPMLSYNDKFVDMAMYPNGDYLMTKDIIRNGKNTEVEFTIADQRYKNWTNAKDMLALGYYRYDWCDNTDKAYVSGDSIVTTSGTDSLESGRRVRFLNLLEEIDVPNEYYLDRETGYLYIYMPEGFSQGESLRFTTYNGQLLNISSCENIVIRGIKFEGSVTSMVKASNCTGLTVDRCEFTASGGYALSISSGTNVTITNNHLHDLAAGGIYILTGDAQTLTSGNSIIENCKIERFMQYIRTYQPGIGIGNTWAGSSVGVRVSHCEISDSPHFAISYMGNDHIIEYNDIYNVCNDSADSGAIYTGRRWADRGNIIRHNYFHSIKKREGTVTLDVQAVYLDDMHSSTAVYSNVFYDCSFAGLYGGGRDNTFENNLIIDCEHSLRMDARGTTWMDSGEGSQIRYYLYKVPYTSLAYSKYPHLANILSDEPEKPKYNVIRNNVSYRSGAYELDSLVTLYGTVEMNYTLNNTSIVADYSSRNFSVPESSMIYRYIPDFQPADFENIGTYSANGVKPEIYGAKISGDEISGSVLTLDYTYAGYDKAEGESVIEWYRRKSGGSYEKISSATGKKALETDNSYRGYTVRAKITPVNENGEAGTGVYTNEISIRRPFANEIMSVSENRVTNNDSAEALVGIFNPQYETLSGFKHMTALTARFITIQPGESAEIDGIAILMDNLEPVR